MQPQAQAAQQMTMAGNNVTSSLRNFYQNIAGTPSSSQAESDISSFGKLTPRSGDILSAFDEQYGVNAQSQRVGDLRKSVMQAEDLVNNVDDNVLARTSNALVSDAQRARLTASEKDPLVKQLNMISRNFDVANQDLSGLREQSNRFSTAELGDVQTMRESLDKRLGTAQQREEAERIKQQQEEENRRWWEDFQQRKADSDRNFALKQKEFDNNRNYLERQLAQATANVNRTVAQQSAPKVSSPQITKTYKNSSGQIKGYETPLQSVLTDVGAAEQRKMWEDEAPRIGGMWNPLNWFR